MITGATGFTGSFLVEHYARQGWRVHGTYRDAAEDQSWVPAGVVLHRIDLCDKDATADLVAAVSPDVVHHLAAQSSVTASWEDPMGTLAENTVAQYNLLEALVAFRPHAHVVVVGSCDEYGNVAPEQNPLDESQELRPASPYALSKVAQDLMGRQYAEVNGLHVVRVRPFLQIGPRRPSRFVAGSFARQVAEIAEGLRDPVIHVGNIDLLRDFTDVRDVARAYALLVDAGAPGEVYNIASGTSHSLRDLLHVMMRVSGVEAEIRQEPQLTRRQEPQLLIGDSSRLRALTGWEPAVSFEQSAADTLAYWRAQVRQALVAEGERS